MPERYEFGIGKRAQCVEAKGNIAGIKMSVSASTLKISQVTSGLKEF
jgi:hypothetical protein